MLDVLIIGGGPAGTAAGMALRRRGRSVMIVEQRRFPRDKVCGECLSSLGIGVLERLGVAGAVRGQGARELRRAVLYATDGRACELNLPQAMWGISRRVLDATLLSTATDAGTELFQPARCEGIFGGAPPHALVRDLTNNTVHRIEAQWIIVANGKGQGASRDLGVKARFENVNVPADAIELFGLRGHYGGLAPIEDGYNAAFSVPAARLRQCGRDLDAVMDRAIAQNVALARRLAGARRVGDWIASPLPRFGVRGNWPSGVIPVGNAAAALEPIGGEGMGLALYSGEMAAEAIDAALSGGAAIQEKLRAQFARLWRGRRIFCRAMALALSSPPAARVIIALGSAGIGVRVALAAVGKPRSSARFATASQ